MIREPRKSTLAALHASVASVHPATSRALESSFFDLPMLLTIVTALQLLRATDSALARRSRYRRYLTGHLHGEASISDIAV